MVGHDKGTEKSVSEGQKSLKDALREARIETAERSAVIVELRDAELARLELLDEALDPLFKDIPANVELFDRGISRGDVPRLWIDAIAHIDMGRDKRQYRFVQETRYGRTVLAESYEAGVIVEAVTNYVARRIVERERALADGADRDATVLRAQFHGDRWRMVGAFLFGLILGIGALFVLAMFFVT